MDEAVTKDVLTTKRAKDVKVSDIFDSKLRDPFGFALAMLSWPSW
jgi:hypothetical protein